MDKFSISELSNHDLEKLRTEGHIGSQTKNIFELTQFYNSVEEESKRRALKLKELQKKLPIAKHFYVSCDSGVYMFRVLGCEEAPKDQNLITHYLKVEGCGVRNHSMFVFETKEESKYQLSDKEIFGWNAEKQYVVCRGEFGSFEVIEVSKEHYKDYEKIFINFGLIE